MSFCLKAHHFIFEMFDSTKMGLALTQKLKLASLSQKVSPLIKKKVKCMA